MKRILAIFTVIMSFYININAGPELVGTTSTNFMKIPPFARPASMGEAFVSVSDGTSGIYYNPAGIASLTGFEVQLTHIEWFQGIKYEYLAAVTPFPALEFGKLGIGIAWFRINEMPQTSELPSYEHSALDNTDFTKYINHYFEPYDYSVNLSYAMDIKEDLSSGVTLRLASQNIDSFSGSNITADFGFIYKAIWNGHFARLGLSLSNLGSELQMDDAAFEPPITVKAGISDQVIVFDNKFLVSAQGTIYKDYDPLYSIGAEYWLYDIMALRAGYKTGAFDHPTFGAGLKYAGFQLDYAFINYEELGATHRISLLYTWGVPPVKLKASPYVFSPNLDLFIDETNLMPLFKSKDKINSVSYNIYSSSGRELLQSFPGDENKKLFKWDGSAGNETLPDGVYMASVTAEYEGGTSESEKVPVEIDNTPPAMRVDAEPKFLKPGDASESLLIPATFTFYAADRNGVASWQFVIWDVNKKPFYSTGGQGSPPISLIWDGKSNDGRYVETGEIYYYSLITKDSVGNKANTKPQSQVVLLKEIKLTFASDALFKLGQADVRITAYKTLKSMKNVLIKYPESEILVAGYTDNLQPKGGKYRSNKELSKARADAVKFFMVNLLGIDGNRIKTEGFGELNPIASNETPEGRNKNRRVEIVIQSTIYK